MTLSWTGTGLCPVRAVLAFLVQRKARPGPFFREQAGKALTRKEFVWLKYEGIG